MELPGDYIHTASSILQDELKHESHKLYGPPASAEGVWHKGAEENIWA